MRENTTGSYKAVYQALCHRVRYMHLEDMVVAFGIDQVMEAIEEKASQYEGYDNQLEEIGSSDVSCWIIDIKEQLQRQKARNGMNPVI